MILENSLLIHKAAFLGKQIARPYTVHVAGTNRWKISAVTKSTAKAKPVQIG